jgi:NAD+--asparagine ADP-ribosyltransferase|tara:strand:- start:282 stop:440 length:159 start_codon:yes stop_codon:yes gene_type:complete
MKSKQVRNELEQNNYINTLYSIVDKLEKRIFLLEKVLESHAKQIGQLREEKI